MESKRQPIEIDLEMDLGREAPARAPQSLAILPPFGSCRRDVGAHYRGVEHLNQMRCLACCCERVEEGLEHASLAQAPEALPNGIPVAERLG